MTVATPTSVTDPYPVEPSNTAPVRLHLTFASGATATLSESVRVLAPHLALRHRGVVFIARGTDAQGVRLYRELPILALTDEPTHAEQTAYKRGFAAAVAMVEKARTYQADPTFSLRQLARVVEVLDEKMLAPLRAALAGMP